MRNVPDVDLRMKELFWRVLEVLGALPVSMAPTLTLALGLTVRLEPPPPLDWNPDGHHQGSLRLDPTKDDLDDDLTASTASWRPHDLTSTAGETCDGEGRQGEEKGEAWLPVEAVNVGVDPGASL